MVTEREARESQRSEVVEYQLEHHREALGERLTALETLTT